MKSYTIIKYSKTEKLHLLELPVPAVQDHEILIQVHAASVNQLDAKIKAGEFKMLLPYKLPLILGHDLAGVVTKVGSMVTKFKIGDEVYAKAADFHIGAFAEYISLHEDDAARKPSHISMEQAASLPLVALTAWQALVEKARLQKGQKVFIQAGSGGVGTIAIQLAKHLGAQVATTTSAANFELVKSLGADVVIDYRKDDFEKILKDYDVVLNSQDSNTLEKSLRVLKPGGIAISITGPPTTEMAAVIKVNWFMKMILNFLSSSIRKQAKSLGVNYSFLFMRAEGSQLSEITRLIESGAIQPVVDKIYPFDQTNEALAYVESGRAKGKVVIKIK